MRTGRVRMADVAREAGVSRTTTSFVLNGRDAGIPEETRLRVRGVAERMGYQPHAGARALATGRTGRIGIILNEPESFRVADLYFASILEGITQGALECNVNLLLHSARYQDWQALRDDVLSGPSDGTLLVGRFTNDPLTAALLDAEVPTVCVSYNIAHPTCYSVDCDNVEGARRAMQHLIALGHRRIAFLYPGDGSSWGCERLQGARESLHAAGLGEDALWLRAWSESHLPSLRWVHETCNALLASDPRPTAVLCCDEWRAFHLLERLLECGVRVPRDMALVSFNSTELSARARPAITSVHQPLAAIGAEAVRLLVARIEGQPIAERTVRLPVSIDVRESCGAALTI